MNKAIYNVFNMLNSLVKDILQPYKTGLLICLFHAIFQLASSQTDHISRNNYTGDWENPSSWEPVWETPQTDSVEDNITINGFISCRVPLAIDSNGNTLTINDTLTICGDLRIGNNSSLLINRNAILIVNGNLIAEDKASILLDTNACIIVTGDYNKLGSVKFGSFISNNHPSNIFIGGTVPYGLDPSLFPAFMCPGRYPYYNSQCSYGNMLDLANEPIFTFFNSVFETSSPTIIASGPLAFCEGNSVTLTSTEGLDYLWSTGETTSSIEVSTSGIYTVKVSGISICPVIDSASVTVVAHSLPNALIVVSENSGMSENDGIICQGTTATLTASGGAYYSWSTGDTTAAITTDLGGLYSVAVSDTNGCVNTAEQTITIIPLPIVDAGSGGDVCGNSYILSASSSIGTGAWTLVSGAGDVIFSPNGNDPSATISVDTYGDYQLEWTATYENCPASANVSIAFYEIPIADAGADQVLNSIVSTRMQADLPAEGTGEWLFITGTGIIDDISSPVTEVNRLANGENILLWTVSSDHCSASDSVEILVDITDLFVPEVITPNEDGKNDFLIIDGIEQYSPAELIIVNRWGSEVYAKSDFMNDWNGTRNNGSDYLPNDTYYYTLKLANGEILKGFVVIKK